MDRKIPIDMRKAWHVLMQNGRCTLCGEPLFLTHRTHTFGAFSFEHKQPRALGGMDHRRNLAGSHHECNKARLQSTRLKLFRPEPRLCGPREPPAYRRIMRSNGIWWSHFRLQSNQ